MILNFADDLRNKFPNLKKNITESLKIWHGLYPYKMTLDSYINNSEIWYWLGAKYGIPKPEINTKFRVRSSVQTILYFIDYNDLKDAVDFFNPSIINIHVLLSQKAQQILNNNRRIRLKKQLYFNQYRHKILFKPIYHIGHKTLANIKKWSKEQFEFDISELNEIHYTYRNNKAWLRWNQREPTLFLTDSDDVTLVKLVWSEYCNAIETIQLIEDLKGKS